MPCNFQVGLHGNPDHFGIHFTGIGYLSIGFQIFFGQIIPFLAECKIDNCCDALVPGHARWIFSGKLCDSVKQMFERIRNIQLVFQLGAQTDQLDIQVNVSSALSRVGKFRL